MITDKLALTMQYDYINGPSVAKRWKVPASTLARWKRLGIVPDYRALNKPLNKEDLATEEKLIRLIESGWLKARPIGRFIHRGDKINSLMTARRYPNDERYHVRHISWLEIWYLKPLLHELQRTLGTLLYLASITPEGQNHSDVVQADLRKFLRLKYINGLNVRTGMNERQVGRFWAFKHGGKAKREDLDSILNQMKVLATLLV